MPIGYLLVAFIVIIALLTGLPLLSNLDAVAVPVFTLIVVVIVLKVIGWVVSPFLGSSEGTHGDQPLHTYDAWGDLQSGKVEHVDKNTKIIHAEGYAFEVTNRFNGQPMVREVDPSSKASKSRWTHGGSRSIANHIKYVVNTRQGRGGN